MRLVTFVRFMRQILREGPADLDWIQRQGLLAVKLTQIFALRPDLLSIEKCRQLQKMYRDAATIPLADFREIIEKKANPSFHEAIDTIEEEPMAAASVGQVHRAKLKTGEEVVVKVIKSDHEKRFKKDVSRLMRWMKLVLMLSPKLRRVGNPPSSDSAC